MDSERLRAHKLRNELQTAALVATLALLCAYLAWFIGGAAFAGVALAVVGVLAMQNPIAAPRLVMALYRGRPLAYESAPDLYEIVLALARRAGLERLPTLYYLPTRLLNAFTTGGRRDAAIAVSDGLLRRMSRRELVGVLAHEISHLANGDTRVMAFADLVSRITGMLSLAGQILLAVSLPLWILTDVDVPWLPILVLLFAPTISALVQLALSRSREYEADRTAAELSGDPEGLAAALQRLERDQRGPWERLLLPGRRAPEPSLLRTHPPTGERVRRLLELHARPDLPRPLFDSATPWPRGRPGFLPDRQAGPPRRRIGGFWY